MSVTTRIRKTVTTADKAAALRKANADSLRAAQQHAAEKDGAVLNGVVRTPAPAKPIRKAAPKAAPKSSAPAPAKAARKPARKPAYKTEDDHALLFEGSVSKADSTREHNQELARRLVDALASEFGKDSQTDQIKVANWVKHLPTGDPTGKTDGAAGNRYWPKGLHRPTTQDWDK